MAKLSCDICNGALVMQEGGTQLICEVCGVKYTAERIREKAATPQEKSDKQPAAPSRQTQQLALVAKYYDSGDFSSAERVVKKMLESTPDDPEANRLYDELQVLKHMKVVNGVLVKYTGRAKEVTVPGCVKCIGEKVFAHATELERIVLSDGVEELDRFAFHTLKAEIILPKTLTRIGDAAFNQTAVEEVVLPEGVTHIGHGAFCLCKKLRRIVIPESVQTIGPGALESCPKLVDVTIPERFVVDAVFAGGRIHRTIGSDEFAEAESKVSPWYKKARPLPPEYAEARRAFKVEKAKLEAEWRKQDLMHEEWRAQGRCYWCGGRFTLPEWFTGHPRYCTKCGKDKNY